MALTSGTQAASATPAADQYALLATALTAAGWTEEVTRVYTASIMGTTAACKVWYSPSTSVASGIYTGCIVSFEIDDTNFRIRFRVCEKFDSTLSGASSLNTKWAATGSQSNTSDTPTANYGINDSFVAHFQTQATTAEVGWVNIPVSASGFAYWLGVNSTYVLYFNNSGGLPHWVVAGHLEDLAESGGDTAVILAGRMESTNNDVSWTFAAATGNGNVRCSKMPLITTAFTGPFCFQTAPTSEGGVATTNFGGNPTAPHKWLTAGVAWPVFLHGVGSGAYTAATTHLGFMTGFVVLHNSLSEAQSVSGDTVTVGGTTYTIMGRASAAGTAISIWVLAVDGSEF